MYYIGILFSEAELLKHEDEYEAFYSSFVALSAHYLSASAGDGSYMFCTQLINLIYSHLETWYTKKHYG